MYDAISIGGATKDIFLILPTKYIKSIRSIYIGVPEDRKIDIEGIKEYTGGSATNVSATLSAFGKKVMVVTRIGNDDYGRFIKEDLKKRNIALKAFKSEETAFSIILVIGNEMSILTYRKAESSWNLSENDIKVRTKSVYLGPLPKDSNSTVETAISIAKKNNALLVWNPGSSQIEAGLKSNLEYVKSASIICMNDYEAKRFVGKKTPIENAITLSKYAQIAIVTLGKKGSIIAANNKLYIAGTYPAQPINIVGAGDAFCSGFMNAILDKRPIEEAISLGSYNAASVVSHHGAKEGIVNEYPKRLVNIKVRTI
ncbi:MAG: carbohydrate kinase family protein [Candidatus Rehaiarchaeum fermentans]|nr:carbohydrate kinase family protein [Candidatus Rehaiarchaeum fermentans]